LIHFFNFSELQKAIYALLLIFAYWRRWKCWSETNIFSRRTSLWMRKCYLARTRLRGINRKGGRRNWCRGKTTSKLALQRIKGQNDHKVSKIRKRIIMSANRNLAE